MNIAGVEIGGSAPCRVVAEVSNNHNGDIERCLRLLDAIKDAGADFAKFQCYTPAELVELRGDGPAPDPWGSEGWSMADLYAKAQTPHEWFPWLVAHCDRIGLPWFSSVFGRESLALLESLDCPAYKIAALDVGDDELAQAAIETCKPVIISLREAATWAPSGHPSAGRWLATLYCPEGYPQSHPLDLTPLPQFDGLSYHGTHPGTLVQAANMGSKILECHVQLAAEPSELEAGVSLTEVQLSAVCVEIGQDLAA